MNENRWLSGEQDRGESYDERFDALARRGEDPHGEAGLVASLVPSRVLDAGCGTGRVAIELTRRGIEAIGVDLDPSMLQVARRKAPDLTWVEADLATVDLRTLAVSPSAFDVVVLAGNVMIFLAPGTEEQVVANLARHVAPGGALVAGFQLLPGRLGLVDYDRAAEQAELQLTDRWSTWSRDPFTGAEDYAVSVHRRAG